MDYTQSVMMTGAPVAFVAATGGTQTERHQRFQQSPALLRRLPRPVAPPSVQRPERRSGEPLLRGSSRGPRHVSNALVALYLMTSKGLKVLEALVENGLAAAIREVVIGRDDGIENDRADDIAEICRRHGIRHEERAAHRGTVAPYSIAISWRWMIHDGASRLIVLHDSLLPKYRGFAPLVTALLAREPEVGVTALFASDEYDRGDIIARSVLPVAYPVRIAEVIERISSNYAELALDVVRSLASGAEIEAVKQDEAQASYSLWRDEDDYLIDWGRSAEDVRDLINAVSSPYRGASTFINGERKIRIIRAEAMPEVAIANRDCGKVIFVNDRGPVIVCGSGLLRVTAAYDDATGADVLPFARFRTRLTGPRGT